MLRFCLFAKFSPSQPRDNHGRWTIAGGSRFDPARPSGDDRGHFHQIVDITGFTKHGINQAINRGVNPADILDAVTNPLRILPNANGTTQYIGIGAGVVLNPSGRVVTVWPK